ncbi:MAG TPA: helix-turn-helix transcriptional regulator [Chitinolyticbacter sp.]|nr:helix-turn-helix transcriptional regulator [Chitinolyticbacter sp.]
MHAPILQHLLQIDRNGPRMQLGRAGLFQFREEVRVLRAPFFWSCLIVVLAGEKEIIRSDGVLRCRPGQWIAIGAGQDVSFRNLPDPQRGYFAGLSLAADPAWMRRFTERYAADLPARLDPAPVFEPDALCWKTLNDYVEQVLLPQESPLDEALAEHRWQALWLAMARQGVGRDLVTVAPENWRERVLRHIGADPAADWKMTEVAGRLCLSEATLRRRLALEHTTFAATLADARMDRALYLVMKTPQPVQRIAEACGYTSPSRFTDAFRSRFGLTPTALRSAASAQPAQASAG